MSYQNANYGIGFFITSYSQSSYLQSSALLCSATSFSKIDRFFICNHYKVTVYLLHGKNKDIHCRCVAVLLRRISTDDLGQNALGDYSAQAVCDVRGVARVFLQTCHERDE